MKKLLLIVTFFLTFTSFSQDLDTLIVKNSNTYRFVKTNSTNSLRMINKTTYNEFTKLPAEQVSNNELQVERARIINHMTSDGDTNIKKYFFSRLKEVFENCNLKNFNHTRAIDFFISINSKGDIIDLKIFLSADLFERLGYDKIIEFESRIRKEYKFKPFISQKMGKKSFISTRLTIDEMNDIFK